MTWLFNHINVQKLKSQIFYSTSQRHSPRIQKLVSKDASFYPYFMFIVPSGTLQLHSYTSTLTHGSDEKMMTVICDAPRRLCLVFFHRAQVSPEYEITSNLSPVHKDKSVASVNILKILLRNVRNRCNGWAMRWWNWCSSF